VTYQLRLAILKKVRQGEDVLPEIQGREEAKRDVVRALLSGAHPYLVSEEGTGKTRLARSLTHLLPAIPAIKGCSYHDDPKWPPSLMCPRCRASQDPAREFGVEVVPGETRFSRIQGNEYTNEAKLLGLKDIQAIAKGKSPSDPLVFTGTGIFRANRGILFVDELPAIPTKVQVLFHPVLEEKKAVLEEYNWQHPLDLVVVATGNPQGFSHVNEVPRPLVDRLELIYLDLPSEEVEREIALMERFRGWELAPAVSQSEVLGEVDLNDVERRVALPWWVMELVNKSVRVSRVCRWVEKRASIRATTRSVDHTYASAELGNRNLATLQDAADGLKLALRGRIGLRADLIDFEKPEESFTKADQVVEDLLWNALEDFSKEFPAYEAEPMVQEIEAIFADGTNHISDRLLNSPELSRAVNWLKEVGRERVNGDLLNPLEQRMTRQPEKLKGDVLEEYHRAAFETVVNIALHRGTLGDWVREKVFAPQMVSWARKGGPKWL
jgi:Mg-chelatase subunit ChlI